MANDPAADDPPADPDPNSSETDDPKPNEPKPEDVEKMRAALKKANKEAEQARLKLKEIEDREKSDSDKLTERATAAEKLAEEHEHRAMRLEVALAKGLNATQAKRLVGTNAEELEADADELLASFAPAAPSGDGAAKPPSRQPNEKLTPGGDDGGTPEPDIDKVLTKVPRL